MSPNYDSWDACFSTPAAANAEAHGRVNLIGEHTDYNHGYVLPTPIPQCARAWIAPRTDQTVRAASKQFPQDGIREYQLGEEKAQKTKEPKTLVDFVMGATSVLQADGLVIRGFELFVDSDVPIGGGLSSSAAVSVAVLRALRTVFELTLDDIQIAKLAQRIEHEFIGAEVGLMDQMSASLGRPGSALFFDVKEMETELVPLPTSVDWLIVDSGVSHDHSVGDYNARTKECRRACELLDVDSLRELTTSDLSRIERLPSPIRRRARHVVTENQRVLDAVAALKKGDLKKFGVLMTESHDSQAGDYEVSVDEIDLLVDLALKQPGVLGARLTGGGFGGSIVALFEKGKGQDAGRKILEAYEAMAAERFEKERQRKPTALVL